MISNNLGGDRSLSSFGNLDPRKSPIGQQPIARNRSPGKVPGVLGFYGHLFETDLKATMKVTRQEIMEIKESKAQVLEEMKDIREDSEVTKKIISQYQESLETLLYGEVPEETPELEKKVKRLR